MASEKMAFVSGQSEGQSDPFAYDNSNTWKLEYEVINYNRDHPRYTVNMHVSQEELGSLEEKGFLHKKQMLSPEAVELLREATEEVLEQEMKMEGKEYYPGNGIFIRYLMDKHPAFIKMLKYEPILSVIKAMLGPQVQLMDLVARITFLDEPSQQLMWHIHNRVVPNPLPPFFAHPHSLDVLIYLDDTDETNGTLCVIPGSHKEIHRKIEFRDFKDKEGQLIIPTKAGDCIFSHSNLWHRVTPSQNVGQKGSKRRALLMGFMPAWFKRDFPKGIRPKTFLTEELKEQGDGEIKELLGYFEWI